MSYDSPSPSAFQAPSLEELAVLLPQYEMKDFLAQGGMGAVYLARQISLDRLVAIKVLPPAWGAESGYAQRFQVEARSMAKLQHNHIVSVFDFGVTQAGHFYLVMEYVEGQTMHEMIRLHRLKVPMVHGIALQLCDAVAYAHEHGVLHRDIKPGNVLVNTAGQIKVADFGLARAAGAAVEEESLGTPDYAAPELLQEGALVDHRADIFALGIVFQEMLTGRVPGRPREPLGQHPQVDPAWESIIVKATHAEASERFKTTRELRDAVASIGHRAPFVAPRPKPSNRPTPPVHTSPVAPQQASSFPLLPVLVSVVLIGAAVFWWMRNKGDVASASGGGPEKPPLIAGAGSSVPQTGATKENNTETVSPLQEAAKPSATAGAPLQLPDVPPGHVFKLKEGHKDIAYDVVFLPDQRHAASCSLDGTVVVWDVQTGERLRTLGPVTGSLFKLALSRDGTRLVATGGDYKAYLWNLTDAGSAPAKELALTARAAYLLGFSADDSSVLIGTTDTSQSLLAWNVLNEKSEVVPGFRQAVSGMEMQPGGAADAFIAAGTRTENGKPVHEVWLGAVGRRSLVKQYPAPSLFPFRMRIAPDGRTALGISGGRIHTWDLESGKAIAQTQPLTGGLNECKFVDNGRLILCGAQDRCLHVFETFTGAEVWKSEPQDAQCTNFMTVSADGQYAITCGGYKFGNPLQKDGDYALHVWRLPKFQDLKSGDADKARAKQDLLTMETSDPALWTLLGTLAQEWEEKTVKNADAARKDLDEKYLAALRREVATASPRDREAWLGEISRVANKEPLPSSWLPVLTRLGSIYAQQVQLLPRKASEEKEQLASVQKSKLEALEQQRAGAGDVVGAQRVRLVIEALSALEGEMVLAKLQSRFRSR